MSSPVGACSQSTFRLRVPAAPGSFSTGRNGHVKVKLKRQRQLTSPPVVWPSNSMCLLRPIRCGLLATALAALFLPSCGGGGGSQPTLTCSASCTDYRWDFGDGAGANAEWCAAPLSRSGGVSQCSAKSTDMLPPMSCPPMLGQQISTCTGTIESLVSERQWTVRSTVDPTACTLTVTVDGVGTCTAP